MEAKRNEHEQSTEAPTEPVLCPNGCGFYGNKLTMNLCSKCFREWEQRETTAAALAEKQAAMIGSSSTAVEQREDVEKPEEPRLDDPKAAAATAVSSDDMGESCPPPRKVQKNRGRCWDCRKKVGLLGFECRCGYVFCSMHRHADQHQCDFDYMAFDRENLSKANPVVMAEKVDKI